MRANAGPVLSLIHSIRRAANLQLRDRRRIQSLPVACVSENLWTLDTGNWNSVAGEISERKRRNGLGGPANVTS